MSIYIAHLHKEREATFKLHLLHSVRLKMYRRSVIFKLRAGSIRVGHRDRTACSYTDELGTQSDLE